MIRPTIDSSKFKLQLFIAVLVTMLIDIPYVHDSGTIDPCTISTIKPFIAVVIILSIVCVNGNELLTRCIVTGMIIIIIILTIIITNTIAVFIAAVYVNDNGIIQIIVVHTNDSFYFLHVVVYQIILA